jgi:hypothetical protein
LKTYASRTGSVRDASWSVDQLQLLPQEFEGAGFGAQDGALPPLSRPHGPAPPESFFRFSSLSSFIANSSVLLFEQD